MRISDWSSDVCSSDLKIAGQGINITPDLLHVAETAPLILPIHRDLDALREDASGAGKIGTTRRGIGPAYEDKVGRRAIRICDLAHLDDLRSEEHTSELQSLMRISYAVFCLKKHIIHHNITYNTT